MLPFLIVEIEVSKEITYQFINPRNVERFQKIYLVILYKFTKFTQMP